jgi:hypothetical protein
MKALTLFTLTRHLIQAVTITCKSKMNAKRQEGTGMANQKHLDILKQGVKTWNQWREEHLDVLPDLTEEIND